MPFFILCWLVAGCLTAPPPPGMTWSWSHRGIGGSMAYTQPHYIPTTAQLADPRWSPAGALASYDEREHPAHATNLGSNVHAHR